MKKKLVSVLLCGALAATTVLAGCGGSNSAAPAASSSSAKEEAAATEKAVEEAVVEEAVEEAATEAVAEAAAEEAVTEAVADAADAASLKYALVLRAAGNPYCEREAAGFEEVMKEIGATDYVLQYPEQATADAQIPIIQSLISQGVDVIATCSNDANALDAVIKQAMDSGIKIVAYDAATNPQSRATFCNQAGTVEVGQALIDAVYDLCGGEGEYAILSATSQSTNQNAWIDAMKSIAESDSKYSKLILDEVAYGDDEPQKSTDQTQALLTKYPDLKVICAPTTVGIAAAAKVVQDQGSSVRVTGLGLPSEMAPYIGEGDEYSCPYMFLWNPIDLGRLTAWTAIALGTDKITGAAGETFEAGDMELSPYTITEAADGGTEVILGPPFRFDPSNIDEWKEVY